MAERTYTYRLIGGPEDGKVIQMALGVDEITMPKGDVPVLTGAERTASEKKYGHPYGGKAMFHRYRCRAKETIDGVIIMRHDGYTPNPMDDFMEGR